MLLSRRLSPTCGSSMLGCCDGVRTMQWLPGSILTRHQRREAATLLSGSWLERPASVSVVHLGGCIKLTISSVLAPLLRLNGDLMQRKICRKHSMLFWAVRQERTGAGLDRMAGLEGWQYTIEKSEETQGKIKRSSNQETKRRTM